MSTAILVEERDDRVVATLNRPEVRNAIDRQTSSELNGLCALLEEDPRILLLTGAGESFAAGADINQMRERRRDDALRGINSAVFSRLQKLPMPTIALMDGYALGGGAELAYACDFRLGTTRVKIGNPEPGLGILASAGGTWRLRELVPETVAKEMLLAGRILDADAARAAGLLSEVVEPAELLDAGHRWADRIAAQVPLAIRLTKAVFHAPRESHPFVDDLAQAVLFETDEKHERMTQFLERKKR
ncbi:enoyl-CoA hydratase/isomerase family protein [Aeromicrobium sp. CF4.19]|uniref:enoyl-CoA hydratase/isomerase family protein n=1 Tax=Aeromicrobium sp. CF4.19 TaxID=3373082 RepID=UPI003EE805EE